MTCQTCGTALTGQAVGGLCANCLLDLALASPPKGTQLPSSPSGQSPPVGNLGDYQLLEMIGRGGMGIVYKALQKDLNRMVALKMVQNGRDASPDVLERFRIEAEAAAKLDHPNIVPTYQIGELNGQPYFSMKLVAGASLGKRFGQWALKTPRGPGHGKAPPNLTRQAQVEIATLLAKVARAVDFAHQHGVIHRDLKPNNILIDPDGEPHLTDFGIAKLLEKDLGLTRTHDVLGTPAYMAPEQASGKAISSAVDTYSLGAILYESLTGQPPFRGQTPLDTMRKAMEEEPVPPTTVNGGADDELAAICLKCLEKNPMHRYETTLGVAEDLERWLRHEPVQAKRAGRATRAARWARRNPVGASLVATLCAGLAGALVLLGMVSTEKNKTAAVLKEVELAGHKNAQLLSLTVALLNEQLEALWLKNDLRVLHISSEQLAALSGLDIIDVPDKASMVRYQFGLSANESPTADAIRYGMLLSHLERQLSQRRGAPIRIDLNIYKYKEDRTRDLVNGSLAFARMGTIYYLRTKQQHPGIQTLVEMESAPKTALFFTRTNTGINTLEDLKGRRMAFGDTASSVTFWGQAKLADAGVTGQDFAEYTFLNTRSEFIEDAHELGFTEAMKPRLWLHSTADVIEAVLSGRFDAGVTTDRGFERHKHRGLVRIARSEFIRRPSPWVAAASLPADVVRDFVEILTALRSEAFLLVLPDSPLGFNAITEASHNPDRETLERIEKLFPVQNATPSLSNPRAAPQSAKEG